MNNCQKLYEDSVKDHPIYHRPSKISFDLFRRAVATVDVERVMSEADYEADTTDVGELGRALLADPQFSKVLGKKSKMSSDKGLFFENLDCYIVLRLLAENITNLDKEVVWGFHDVVYGGYVKKSDLYSELDSLSKFLIVTEGTSDAVVLKKSLNKLHPDINDFFDFIDVEDNYPFSGVGNLANFCIGLSIINITRNVVFVIDNDSAGLEAFQKIQNAKKLSENIKVLVLPEMPEFRDFPTVGPHGIINSNINGKAAAIEMYLDLTINSRSSSVVKWTSYNKKTETYQGELIYKENYVEEFHRSHEKPEYDMRKIAVVWDEIIKACCS